MTFYVDHVAEVLHVPLPCIITVNLSSVFAQCCSTLGLEDYEGGGGQIMYTNRAL